MDSSFEEKSNGLVFNIQRWSIHDGPGVRTVVFLKGCPLRCRWCCNPESEEVYNEIAFFKDKCIGCHRCVKNCPHGAVTLNSENKQEYNREICREQCYTKGLNTFPCTKECYGHAIRPIAELKTVDEIMKEVMKDEGIYKESKVGGLTLSGGEFLLQPGFSLSLLKAAKEKGITTAIESSVYGKWEVIESLLEYVDFIFVDLKYFDSAAHKEYTHQDNSLILENIVKASKFAKEKGRFFTVRTPLIPSISKLEDFKRALDFVKNNCADITAVEIMPYHRLGRGKYVDLGKTYELVDLQPYTEDELKPFRNLLASYKFTDAF